MMMMMMMMKKIFDDSRYDNGVVNGVIAPNVSTRRK